MKLLGFEIVVASFAPTEHTRALVAREGHGLVTVESEVPSATCRAAADAELVCLDGYTFGRDLQEALAAERHAVFVIDDLAETSIRADLVLNGNLFATKLAGAYGSMDVGATLLGPSYALVRDEFLHARGSARLDPVEARERKPRVLVSMGGADPARATERFLAALPLLRVSADIRVVVGGANPRVDAIRELVKATSVDSPHDVELFVDVQRMSELMLWCDLAVVAAGSTCLELATIGVPAVVVSVAHNQEPVAAAVSRLGLMASVGRIEDVSAATFADAVNELVGATQRRVEMIAIQRATVDGLGPSRAARELSELLERRAR